MSDPVTGAPAPQPERKVVLQTPPGQTSIASFVDAIKEALPAAGLVLVGALLVTHAMPAGNEKTMLVVVGALAGFLTGRASKGSPP